MVVSFLASGGIGVAVASCPPLCSPRPLKQPPLSATSPRELIYNAHLGNTKGLLSSLRFNAFSPQVAALSFLHVISSPPSFPPTSFSLFPFAPRAPFFTSVISRYSSTFYSLFIIFFVALTRVARKTMSSCDFSMIVSWAKRLSFYTILFSMCYTSLIAVVCHKYEKFSINVLKNNLINLKDN